MNGVNNNNVSVLKGTTIATGIGAVAGGVAELASEKLLLAKPDLFIKSIQTERSKALIMNNMNKFAFLDNILNFSNNLIKDGKISKKSIGKFAAATALISGVGYLAYRGIKAMFSKD